MEIDSIIFTMLTRHGKKTAKAAPSAKMPAAPAASSAKKPAAKKPPAKKKATAAKKNSNAKKVAAKKTHAKKTPANSITSRDITVAYIKNKARRGIIHVFNRIGIKTDVISSVVNGEDWHNIEERIGSDYQEGTASLLKKGRTGSVIVDGHITHTEKVVNVGAKFNTPFTLDGLPVPGVWSKNDPTNDQVAVDCPECLEKLKEGDTPYRFVFKKKMLMQAIDNSLQVPNAKDGVALSYTSYTKDGHAAFKVLNSHAWNDTKASGITGTDCQSLSRAVYLHYHRNHMDVITDPSPDSDWCMPCVSTRFATQLTNKAAKAREKEE